MEIYLTSFELGETVGETSEKEYFDVSTLKGDIYRLLLFINFHKYATSNVRFTRLFHVKTKGYLTHNTLSKHTRGCNKCITWRDMCFFEILS